MSPAAIFDTDCYASTAANPSASDRALARESLAGSVAPSAGIRAHKPGHWLVRGGALSDEQIILRQFEEKSFIYGRVAGTSLLLLSPDARRLEPRPDQTAAHRCSTRFLSYQRPTQPEPAGQDTAPSQAPQTRSAR